jgi:hypothetical protein
MNFYNKTHQLGADRPQTANFIKKGQGGGSGALSQKSLVKSIRPLSANNNKYKDPNRKPGVPKKDEKPLMGLQCNKNFISQNGIDVILKGELKLKGRRGK